MTRINAALYKEMVKSAHCGFVVYNLKGKIIEVNNAYCAMSGYSRSELLKMHIHDIRTEPLDEILQNIAEVRKVGHSIREAYHRKKDGSLVDVELSLNFVPAARGIIFSMVRDITEWKKRERLKEEHVSLLVHDMKSPLTALQMGAQLAKHVFPKPISPSAESAFRTIERNCQRLLELINLILETAKLEALNVSLNRYPIDVGELVYEVVTQIPPDLRERLKVFSPKQIIVMGESEYLKRAVMNLVHNALKYSEEDKPVEIVTKTRGEEALITIKDNGPGISNNDLNHLFEKFFRAHDTDFKPGSGLGLYITKLMVEACQGKITVESQLGKGSTFTIKLPLI